MKLKKEYKDNKQLYITLLIGFAFLLIQLGRTIYMSSADHIKNNLQSAIEKDAYTYTMSYFMSDAASGDLEGNQGEIYLLAQKITDNMTPEEIEALAKSIAEDTAKNIVSKLLTRDGSLGSDILFAKISAAIDERMAKNLLKLSDYSKITEETTRLSETEIAFKAKTEATKLNSTLLSKAYITQNEKTTILNDIKSTVYNNIIGKLKLKGEAGADGTTPIKGVDYMTQSEIQAIATQIQNKIIDSGVLVVTGKSGKNGLTDYELALKYVDNTLSMEEWEDYKTPDIGVDYFTAEEITGYNEYAFQTASDSIKNSILAITGKELGETITDENSEINLLYDRVTAANVKNKETIDTIEETKNKIDMIYDELQITPSLEPTNPDE